MQLLEKLSVKPNSTSCSNTKCVSGCDAKAHPDKGGSEEL